MKDILIAYIDNLTGFAEAISTIFPEVIIQNCVIHQIRNSLKYIASKDQKEFMADLKTVYQAPNKDLAEFNLDKLEDKWGKNTQLSWSHGRGTGIIYRPILLMMSISEN